MTRVSKWGVLVDNGLPARVVNQELSYADVVVESVPTDGSGNIALSASAEAIRARYGWDRFVYITDMPMTADGDPVAAQVVGEAGDAAIVSLPAFGFRLGRQNLAERVRAFGQSGQWSGAGRKASPSHVDGADEHADATFVTGQRARFVGGMVRTNRPGRMLTALASCLAVTVATGGFGIFYGSVWQMAHALSPQRLALVSVVAIMVLSTWLVIYNGMWHRVSHQTSRQRARLDNASTGLTVLVTVLMMFAVTFCGMAALTVAVIPPDYLTEQLGEAVGWRDYVDIAWFTTSLGIMGGALGSNFDGSAKVRRATFSDRENERRDSDEEQPSGWCEDEHEGSHGGSHEAKKAAETQEK